MAWPNDEDWKALADGETIMRKEREVLLTVVECGELVAPTGQLVVCDPYVGLRRSNPKSIWIGPGRYPVKVTVADISGKKDGSHLRVAYGTLIVRHTDEVSREVIHLVGAGQSAPEMAEGEFIGFEVDAGTACFVDDGAVAAGMPEDESRWYDDVFENRNTECWFYRMDDPSHIQRGLANVPLPLASDGSNAILMTSGFGDGVYPVIGGYDEEGKLVRVHVDFNVI